MPNYHRSTSALVHSLPLARMAALSACLSVASVAHAAVFTVDRLDDTSSATTCDDLADNDCSLRGAILAANGLSEPSTINLPAGTYVLSQASFCTYKSHGDNNAFTGTYVPLCITKRVTIQGAGADVTVIDGNKKDRIFFISADATVQINGVAIKRGDLNRANGFSFGVVSGGAGINNQGMLTLTDCVVTGNQADYGGGGGIYNAGTLTILHSSISGNNQIGGTSEGGGIYNYPPTGTVTIADSTISNNTAGSNGGGISIFDGTLIITNSTLSGNTAIASLGGAIAAFGHPGTRIPITITNSTISGNRSDRQGGGIFNNGGADVSLRNVTVTNNVSGGSGGGLQNSDLGTISLRNTIVAGNSAASSGPDCFGFGLRSSALISQGYNLIQNPAGCDLTGDLTGNIIGHDPGLGLLADNAGGSTKTHALSESSPAIDAGNPSPPGSGGHACAVSDQRGFIRPFGTTCDIGAFERSAAFSLVRVVPNAGGNSGRVSVIVAGNGFDAGATVKLTRAGQADIDGEPVQVDVGGSTMAATFDFSGRSLGAWDVVVSNPDHTSQTLTGAFAIEAGRGAQIWVDVLGRFFRRGRPSRLTILYGNRGNVDAAAVPLSLSFPAGYEPLRFFSITAPPPQPGQAREDWSQLPLQIVTDANSGFVDFPLLLPIIPAGFTGILQIGLTLPIGAGDSLLLVATGDPLFNVQLDPAVAPVAVAGARAYLNGQGVAIPNALVPALEQYATTQFQQVVGNGRLAFVSSLGTQVQVHSMSLLQFDLMFFAAKESISVLAQRPVGRPALEAPSLISTMFTSRTGPLGPFSARTFKWAAAPTASHTARPSWRAEAAALEEQQNCPAYKKGDILQPGCSGGDGPNEPFLPPGAPPPPGCNLKDPSTFKKCTLTPEHCDMLPNYKVVKAPNGDPFCVPSKQPDNCAIITNTVGSNQGCTKFPLRPRDSIDPNDKVGTSGVSPAQFILNATTLSYSIHFENLATATGPAQEVVVTDQLDVQRLDLDTLSLGPISFGTNSTLVPSPGVQQYTGGVDLRPKQNLMVAVHANLDKETGVLTWRFTSVDPNTGEFTDDAAAGFLPPNVNPPDGDGSVVFTVRPRPELATGTQFCNEASIVFDVNAPINTPRWCNTLDSAKPVSQVQALATTQSSSTFTVQWAGTDTGSGIAAFSVFVSANDGPVAAFQIDTTSTSATFTGQAGTTYRFYSVARDVLGNIEDPPATFDASTTVGGADVPGDLNGDKAVNCADLAVVRASFGQRTGQPGFDPRADVNSDGVVDIRDLSFISRFLPSGTRCS